MVVLVGQQFLSIFVRLAWLLKILWFSEIETSGLGKILSDIYEMHRDWWQYQHGFVFNIPDGYAGIFSRRWIQMNYFVNLLGNRTYHFRSLVYNAHISRWWWPTTTILQLWAESADWFFHVSSFLSPSMLLEGTENSKLSDYVQS